MPEGLTYHSGNLAGVDRQDVVCSKASECKSMISVWLSVGTSRLALHGPREDPCCLYITTQF